MKNLFIPTKQNNYKPHLLRKIALVAYSLLLVFVNSFGGIFGISQVEASSITADNIISLTNQERAASGLNTLKTNLKLSAAALAKANNMFEEQYWDHFGPNGETPWQFIRAEGYNYVYAGENLAKGFQTSEGVVEAWMASPTHAANILSANYKDIGVAVVEGVLLGKRTILVVQMFGNLTAEVEGASTGTKVSSSENTVIGGESGEIKSIMITSPSSSAITTDPTIDVKGETTGMEEEYTVKVYDNSESVGETTTTGDSWTFDKGSDWSEGDHTLQAEIKGESVKSEKVDFSVDSTPPVINSASILVKKVNDVYEISFSIDDTWTDLRLINGSANIQLTSEDKTNITTSIPVSDLGDSVTIVASDVVGNVTQLDITEYFPQEEVKGISGILLSLNSINVGDSISIAIVALVFILLCIEVFAYWRRGKLREITGDLFVIGSWWLIITVAIFNGYSGFIN